MYNALYKMIQNYYIFVKKNEGKGKKGVGYGKINCLTRSISIRSIGGRIAQYT
ncbi:MAG: hypothetical protein ACYDDB_08490 [bacterium]